jgi:hypothetical protein
MTGASRHSALPSVAETPDNMTLKARTPSPMPKPKQAAHVAAKERRDSMNEETSVWTSGLEAFTVRVKGCNCVAQSDCLSENRVEWRFRLEAPNGAALAHMAYVDLRKVSDADRLLAQLALFGLHPASASEIEEAAEAVVGRAALLHAPCAERVPGLFDSLELFWSPTAKQRRARERYYGVWLEGEAAHEGYSEMPMCPPPAFPARGRGRAVATDGHPAYEVRVDTFDVDAAVFEGAFGGVAWRVSVRPPEGPEYAVEREYGLDSIGDVDRLLAQLALFGVEVCTVEDLREADRGGIEGREADLHAPFPDRVTDLFDRLTLFWVPTPSQEHARLRFHGLSLPRHCARVDGELAMPRLLGELPGTLDARLAQWARRAVL